MAWTSPKTFTDGSVLTAGDMNAHLRDNMNEIAAAKATAIGNLFVVSGTNQIRETFPRLEAEDSRATTTSTTYTDPSGPVGPETPSIETGLGALVFIEARMSNKIAEARSWMSFAVDGLGAADDRGVMADAGNANALYRWSSWAHVTDLAVGNHTFTAKYRVGNGTGVFQDRRMLVIPL